MTDSENKTKVGSSVKNQLLKEAFEPLELKVVDVKVEKGYAISEEASNKSVSITDWQKGRW